MELSVPGRWERVADSVARPGFETIREGKEHDLLLRADGRPELASALLNRHIEAGDIRAPSDRFVIDQLVDDALDALGRSLGECLPAFEPEGGERYVLPVSCIEPRPLLRLEVSRAVLVAMVRKWAPAPAPANPLASRRASLENQLLRLSALVGTSRLRLSELETLAIGDVIKLDASVRERLGVCVERHPVAAETFSLASNDDQFVLQIERPATQW